MQIGVPKETKNHEYRVGMVPACVQELTRRGHQVFIEKDAGAESGFLDAEYQQAGALIINEISELYNSVELIVKVKELTSKECAYLKKNQIVFAYFHLAAEPKLALQLCAKSAIAVAYETVTDEQNGLPLLTPMSEIAGRLSIQAGASYLEKTHGGIGILLGGVAGIPPAKVVIIGGGVAGTQALRVALGMGAEVTVLDKSLKRLRELEHLFQGQIFTDFATEQNIEKHLLNADLVVGAVLVPGARAPKVVSREQIRKMKKGAVMVDLSIDQGGCFETSHPTTHSEPVYVEEGVLHYCVTNMPGNVPHTASIALNNATFPYILKLADKGIIDACKEDPNLLNGLNVCGGKITHLAVASELNLPYEPPNSALEEMSDQRGRGQG